MCVCVCVWSTTKKKVEVIEDDVSEDDPMNLRWKGWNPNKPLLPEKTSGKLVHAPNFPFAKYERWCVILIDRTEKAKVVNMVRITHFQEDESVDMKIMMPDTEGARIFDLYVMCDSYIGCDNISSFKIKVKRKSEEQEAALVAEEAKRKAKYEERLKKLIEKNRLPENVVMEDVLDELEGEDDDESLEEKFAELEDEGKWYLLYFSTPGELVLNLAVLALLCVFIFNFLYSRGWIHTFAEYWARHAAPIVDPVWDRTGAPIWAVVRQWIVTYVYDFTAIVPEPVVSPDDAFDVNY